MQFCDEERPKLYISKPNHHSVSACHNTDVQLKDKNHTLKGSQMKIWDREHRGSQREELRRPSMWKWSCHLEQEKGSAAVSQLSTNVFIKLVSQFHTRDSTINELSFNIFMRLFLDDYFRWCHWVRREQIIRSRLLKPVGWVVKDLELQNKHENVNLCRVCMKEGCYQQLLRLQCVLSGVSGLWPNLHSWIKQDRG